MWQSSNPALTRADAFQQYYGHLERQRSDVTTVQGVINKTGLLVMITIAAGGFGYWLSGSMPSIIPISAIAAFVICLGFGFLLVGKPQLSPVVAPIYAVVEGIFLGGLTAMADRILAAQGLQVVGGVGVQAFIVTACAVVSMLLLYKTGILKPTRTFVTVISVATAAVMLAYMVSFILSMVWQQPLPLISFAGAVSDQGMMGFLGLGINVFILILASLWLVIDFGMVEQQVRAGAPKYMEWYCGFALLVTLAWIYYEALKLVVRLAVLFGGRD